MKQSHLLPLCPCLPKQSMPPVVSVQESLLDPVSKSVIGIELSDGECWNVPPLLSAY